VHYPATVYFCEQVFKKVNEKEEKMRELITKDVLLSQETEETALLDELGFQAVKTAGISRFKGEKFIMLTPDKIRAFLQKKLNAYLSEKRLKHFDIGWEELLALRAIKFPDFGIPMRS